MLLTKFHIIWPRKAVLEIEKSSPLKPLCQMNQNLEGSIYGRSSITTAHSIPIRLQTWPPQIILVSDPSFGSFGKAVSEEKIFRNRPIRNKNCLCRPCLLMNRDEMTTLYRRLTKPLCKMN
jgi:hypothetical protein